jgi:hypothetical protein
MTGQSGYCRGRETIMAPTKDIPWLKIEHAGDRYQVHWRVERRCGPNTVVDLGQSQSFATASEAERWRAVFARALGEDEPPAP